MSSRIVTIGNGKTPPILALRLGRWRYGIMSHGPHVGNMHWDRVTISLLDTAASRAVVLRTFEMPETPDVFDRRFKSEVNKHRH